MWIRAVLKARDKFTMPMSIWVNCFVVVNVVAMFGNSVKLAWLAQSFPCKQDGRITHRCPKSNSTDHQFAIFPVRTRVLGKPPSSCRPGCDFARLRWCFDRKRADEPWRHRCCCVAVCAVLVVNGGGDWGMWLRPKCDVADVGGRWLR